MAHFALQKLHILPSTLANMSEREKAFIYASIQLRIEEEKRQNDKIKKVRAPRRGRGR
ncbi:hypothetical protein SAMN02745135_02009 [Caloranaerobacter azorensis DSM 13643]|uniref:Uncharacterized protein n=1 Tax=Caloranaerobacter azorensis DSM 13643 TaxID=1121264 RepID=A0A1M5VMM4_9FIRM|nr:hypothetical protein SAMN02745135_02009 [Caloranaerobacter azorensis DSM 13643]